MAYGQVLRVEGFNCECPGSLDSEVAIARLLEDAIESAGMTVMMGPYIGREKIRDIGRGPGLTGVAVLYESHVAVHTYPEQRWFYFELLSCKDFDPELVQDAIQRWVRCEIVYRVEAVGTQFPDPVQAPA